MFLLCSLASCYWNREIELNYKTCVHHLFCVLMRKSEVLHLSCLIMSQTNTPGSRKLKQTYFLFSSWLQPLIWTCCLVTLHSTILTERGNLGSLFSPFMCEISGSFSLQIRWKPSEPHITACACVGCRGSLKDTLTVPTLTTSEKPFSKLLNLALSQWSPLEQFRVCGGAEWLQGSSPVFGVNYRFTQKWIFVSEASKGKYW